MRYRILFAILFFTWLASLLVLTYFPDLPEMKIRVRDEWFRLDYLGHLGFYAGLAIFFIIWRTGWRAKIQRRIIIWSILIGLILGFATEFSQRAIPGRSFNPFDIMYNCIGILIGIAMVYALSRKVNSER